MTKSELKKLIVEQYKLEEELINLCKECLEHIFKDDAWKYPKFYSDRLLEDIDTGMEYNGCINSLTYYLKKFQDRQEYIKKQIEKEKNHEL